MDISGMGFTDEVCSLQPGMTLGNLQIVSFIGKGAIGEVYLAQHDMLGKEFAVKVIPKAFSGQEGPAVFKEAARTLTKLDHPHLLRIDDLGEEDLFYWLRMELIVGEETPDKTRIRTLEDLMRYTNGPLSEEEINYYLYYLLLGLDYAHSQGIIHEDLKPSNVMIAEEGVKVAELGVTDLIGHAWDDFHIHKNQIRLEPTPFDPLPGYSRELPALLKAYDYYSPEQRAGKKPDIASNLYSVGLITYRMLTGRRSLSMDLPTRAVNGINPRWDAWVSKALAYDTEDRFQSASEMLRAMPGLEADAADQSDAVEEATG